VEFLQLFQQIIENSHSQKEEGWLKDLQAYKQIYGKNQ
jgi:hypothetical protein